MQTVPTQAVQISAPVVPDSGGVKANFLRRLCVALFEPVDISFLVFFRILFGGILLWETYRYFTNGWIGRYFVEPAVTFSYYGFSWVKPWPGPGMYIHFFVLGLAAACVMAGFLYRIATPVLFLAFTYFFLLDQARYLNHFYLVCLITHPESGQSWTIKPEEHLKSHQVMKMSTTPELILLFGHYLAEEKRREGYENVEVRARVMVSLNGRQPQLLIDPNVDLTKEEITLLPARWIVPLTTPLSSR